MANEKRLIDANALKKRFDEAEADDCEMYGCHIRECFPADDAKEIVDEMPTVDAVEVVHARWAFIGEECCVCSACHNASPVDYYYCPECGAKMDLEE